MSKMKAIVKVVYEFEFEADTEFYSHSEINSLAESLWHYKVNYGFEDKHFSDTEIKVKSV